MLYLSADFKQFVFKSFRTGHSMGERRIKSYFLLTLENNTMLFWSKKISSNNRETHPAHMHAKRHRAPREHLQYLCNGSLFLGGFLSKNCNPAWHSFACRVWQDPKKLGWPQASDLVLCRAPKSHTQMSNESNMTTHVSSSVIMPGRLQTCSR